jgi:hypothetical protein
LLIKKYVYLYHTKNIQMKTIKLGSEVVISDPCYDLQTWCQKVVKNVLPGTYHTNVQRKDAEDWGIRNSLLGALHESYLLDNIVWKWEPGSLGVDSGQLGFFDIMSYRNLSAVPDLNFKLGEEFLTNDSEEDQWYERICELTLETPEQWGTYESGVVSSSGFGDGSYSLYLAHNEDGQVIGFMVDFFVDDNDLDFPEFNFSKEAELEDE